MLGLPGVNGLTQCSMIDKESIKMGCDSLLSKWICSFVFFVFFLSSDKWAFISVSLELKEKQKAYTCLACKRQ